MSNSSVYINLKKYGHIMVMDRRINLWSMFATQANSFLAEIQEYN